MEFTTWDAGLHTTSSNHLEHYGVLGMKWGQRRYQNPDGSLTPAGERHYQKTGEYGYHYKSHATKKYDKKYKKVAAKGMKLLKKFDVKEVDDTDKLDDKQVKKLNGKLEKLADKADKYHRRKLYSSLLDVNEQSYANNISTGKALALSFLAGGSAMKGYAQYRAMANQSGKSMTGHKITSAILASQFGSGGSRMRKAAYIRQDEGKRGLGQKIYKTNTKIQNAASNVIDNIAKAHGGFPNREHKRKNRR